MDQLSTVILLLLHLIYSINCQDWHFQGPNVARGKTATQSPATYQLFTADLAVDGNTGTTLYKNGDYLCTHTNAYERKQGADWTVDLGLPFVIKGIRIYNREDENEDKTDYNDRLRDFTVTADAATLLYDDKTAHPQIYREIIINIPVTSKTPFRRITVAIPPRLNEKSYLTLCEVEIYAVLCEFQTVSPGVQRSIAGGTGTVIESRYITPGSQLLLSCRTGLNLKLQGTELLTCQDDGHFDSEYPTCEKPCPNLPDVLHARYTNTKKQYYPGDSEWLRCDTGYLPQTDQQLTCTQSAAWKTPLPGCSPVTCPFPGPLEHGHYTYWMHGGRYTSGTAAVGTALIISCSAGYRASVRSIGCTESSTWTSPHPSCYHRPCLHPDHLEHGYYTDQLGQDYIDGLSGLFVLGTSLVVSCLTGYTPSVASIRCTDTGGYWGSWDKQVVCTRLTCPTLDDTRLKGGKYKYNTTAKTSQEYDYGTVAEATCLPNFRFNGEDWLRTCGASGSWTGTPGVCVAECQAPTTPNGSYEAVRGGVSEPYTVGQSVQLKCHAGFEINNTVPSSANTPRTCLVDHSWDGEPRTCSAQVSAYDEKTNPITVIAGTGAGGVLLGVVIVVIIIVVYKRRGRHSQDSTRDATAATKTTSQQETTGVHDVNKYMNTSIAVRVANDYEEPSRPDSPDLHTYATIRDVQYENA